MTNLKTEKHPQLLGTAGVLMKLKAQSARIIVVRLKTHPRPNVLLARHARL